MGPAGQPRDLCCLSQGWKFRRATRRSLRRPESSHEKQVAALDTTLIPRAVVRPEPVPTVAGPCINVRFPKRAGLAKRKRGQPLRRISSAIQRPDGQAGPPETGWAGGGVSSHYVRVSTRVNRSARRTKRSSAYLLPRHWRLRHSRCSSAAMRDIDEPPRPKQSLDE